MPFISEREISAGGPIIMMQICNEIGVFSWLAHQGDYGEGVQGRFDCYLSEQVQSIAASEQPVGNRLQGLCRALNFRLTAGFLMHQGVTGAAIMNGTVSGELIMAIT